jgi:hypothetical protein
MSHIIHLDRLTPSSPAIARSHELDTRRSPADVFPDHVELSGAPIDGCLSSTEPRESLDTILGQSVDRLLLKRLAAVTRGSQPQTGSGYHLTFSRGFVTFTLTDEYKHFTIIADHDIRLVEVFPYFARELYGFSEGLATVL